ncbi:MAG: phosphoribosylamine--glycine ligase [Clostridia bacterium]|nr:phosphoribosylamine--glycine ligase [Clostridia bacterium]
MNSVLVIGSGGREHAIVKCLLNSDKVDKAYCLPGNAGIAQIAETAPIGAMEFDKIVEFCKAHDDISLVVVAPDDPLSAGLVDVLEENGIRAFGPNKAAAIIEGSKAFSKDLMKKYDIPTAGYEVFTDYDKAVEYVKGAEYPLVVKASGLALGKGVIICESVNDAVDALDGIMLDKRFGEAGNTVVVEEFLVGKEVSILTFTDGKVVVPMVSSQDHKRVFDHDKGLNTGGMGAFAPSQAYTDEIAKEVEKKILIPTMNAMNSEGRPFKGVLYFGLMMTKSGVKVLEYNARFGDPETQAVLPLIDCDLYEVMNAIIDQRLSEVEVKFQNKSAVCVVMASGGYPESYPKGLEIKIGQIEDAYVYHAGTAIKDGKLVTNGGRVLGVSAVGEDIEDARVKAYKAVENISFDGVHFRRDIGKNL